MKIRSMEAAAAILSAVITLSACDMHSANPPGPAIKTYAEPQASASPTVITLTAEPPATPAPTPTAAPFPYKDEYGRTRHQLTINGRTVNTEHLPFSLPGEEGAYYPLKDVLDAFGVPCLINETSRSATGCVNGRKFKVQARWATITVGKSTIDSSVTPYYVDGCLYVPSFLFMELMDATVDFTADRSAVTLATDITVNTKTSTTAGLKLPDYTFGNATVQLTLSAQDKAACAKLFQANRTGKGDEVMVAHLTPGQHITLKFPAGTYVLKLAYGNEWLGDDDAFGPSGSYTTTEPYPFKKGGRYELKTSAASGDFHSDDQSGFTGN